jgi:uncharacterized membrane protein YheB (UPF0754 family)
MGQRLTDKQKKKILADYAEMNSYTAVGKKNGVSRESVRRLVQNSADFCEIAQKKKEKNTADILAHMETKKDTVNHIIDTYLEKLLDPVIIERSTASQLTTALGTLIDKFTAVKTLHYGANGREDDPLTKALKEEAERMNNGDLS